MPEGVILISADQLGRGSEELGRLLMRNYLYALGERADFPRTIIFINSGVTLCAEGSPVIEELAALKARGATLLVCGTCIDYFGLEGKLATGSVTNMYEIAGLLTTAGQIITL